ncbi:MAG TPA: host attachment protein [Opitutaceae bacterium]|nr:host attachment protein [Opitutaceae bacterium]
MSEHYVILADDGHLKILQQRKSPGQISASLTQVDALDFPHGIQSYAEENTDVAGRFQGSRNASRASGSPTARTGMSIDERLPMKNEEQRRHAADVAGRIEAFLTQKPEATWDLAAGPAIINRILAELSPEVKTRLRNSVAKDLVHEPHRNIISHFSTPA